MLFETPIETDRLLLRPETLADCDDIYRINTDPDVMRYIGDGSILSLSRDELYERLGQLLPKRVNDDYGLAAVVLKETKQYIGACWLKHDHFCDGIELGYRYMKDVWGNGYATEAARSVLQAGFQLPQLEKVFVRTHPDNHASIRVIEKLGFKYVDGKYDSLANTNTPVYQLARLDYCDMKS